MFSLHYLFFRFVIQAGDFDPNLVRGKMDPLKRKLAASVGSTELKVMFIKFFNFLQVQGISNFFILVNIQFTPLRSFFHPLFKSFYSSFLSYDFWYSE